MKLMNYIPNTITGFRIAGSLVLLFLKPFSPGFSVLYVLCGFSDMLDGFLARKTNTAGAKGAVLDSIADTVFIGVVLFLMVPILPFESWMLKWITGIAAVRVLSWAVGFIKFRAFASLHTYANKAAGFALFCSPILWKLWGLPKTAAVVCVLASLSALVELAITVSSRNLLRNKASLSSRYLHKSGKSNEKKY